MLILFCDAFVEIIFSLLCPVYLVECVNGIGTDYRGTKSKTRSGKTCQRWAAKTPHRPKYCVFFLYWIISHRFIYVISRQLRQQKFWWVQLIRLPSLAACNSTDHNCQKNLTAYLVTLLIIQGLVSHLHLHLHVEFHILYCMSNACWNIRNTIKYHIM